jgi:hypothetical protein
MLRKLFLLIFSALLLHLSATNLHAQTEFTTDYHIIYKVNQQGSTHAKFDITLTNNLSNIYASQFSLSIGSTNLSNIKTYQENGQLEPEIAVGNKTTNITIPFKDKALGKDKTQVFTLEFDTIDFSNQLGSVWEISIPKLQKSDNLNSYNLELFIPNSFGNPATITPSPINKTVSGNSTIYRFLQDELFEKGISATFGDTQHFNFALSYHLTNPNVYSIKTEIALPPDTPFQTVIYQALDPVPVAINLDGDGNWLAEYLLSPKQDLHILATGSAQINLKPGQNFPGFSLDDPDLYLQSQQYWEVDNPNIQKIADELKTASKIYQYVVDNLIYDYGRLSETSTRFGAANALANQDSAMCMEFTDLFIAIARAAGIPARAVNGYAYTTNSSLRPLSLKQDILHAWPEYYDYQKQLWIPIDPTWSNTTGGIDFFNSTDLNHFAFTFLGLDSQYPVPAGAYKINGEQAKDVLIDFGLPTTINQATSLSINLPDNSIAGVDLKGQLILTNTGNTALYNQSVSLNTDSLKLTKDSWQIDVLPPFAKKVIDFEFEASSWTDNSIHHFKAQSELSSDTHQLTLSPAYRYALNSKYFYFTLFGLVALFVGLFSYRLVKKPNVIK